MKKQLLLFTSLIGASLAINAQDVTTGLVSKYTFDESNIEDAVLDNDGEAFDVSYSTSGYNSSPGKAIFFDGYNSSSGGGVQTVSRALIEDSIIPFDEAFTISFWFNVNEYNLTEPMIMLSSRRTISGGEAGGIEFSITHGINRFTVAGRTVSGGLTNQYIMEAPQSVSTTTWYFATLTLDAFGQYKLFLNGVQVEDITPANAAEQNNVWVIGTSTRSNEANREFHGLIDDIRFYNRGLTSTEVTQLYNYTPMTVSIDEAEANNDIRVYPNPANDVLNFTAQERLEFSLFDMSGKMMMTGDVNPGQSLDISELNDGMYIVETRNNSGVNRTKVLKH